MTDIESAKSLTEWQASFELWQRDNPEVDDLSHDLSHVQRVFSLAMQIVEGVGEEVDLLVLLAAAYFHDVVNLSKDDPNRSKASALSAQHAEDILRSMDFPEEKLSAVSHAIAAHSFSAGIVPTSWEAKILQDADRMEALGVIGLMRTFYIAGKMNNKPFDREDPSARERPLDDGRYGLDHFEMKLLRLHERMTTAPGRRIAQGRSEFLIHFRSRLVQEIETKQASSATKICLAFFRAGKEGKQLYHPQDPFALERGVSEESFALDRLLSGQSIGWFLEQLKQELMVGDLTTQMS